MKTTARLVARAVGSAVLAVGVASSVEAGARQPVPHSGGGGPRAVAPYHGGGSGTRVASPRGYAAPRGTASGVARYGHGYGYGNGYGYGGSYWGSPWWGWGWYDTWWGWPGYGYAYGPWYGYGYGYGYGPWYAPYDGSYVVPVEAEPPHGPAIIETNVSPSKAEVALDGEAVGFASDYSGRWDELRVAPGRHTIAFREKGYRTLIVDFDAHPGSRYAFNDALSVGDGEEHRTLLAPAPEAPPSAHAEASTTTGRLRVHAEPEDAAVYLDGEYLGLAAELARIHGALAVSTGTHRLEAVHPGYASAVRTIEVGTTDVVAVDLALEHER